MSVFKRTGYVYKWVYLSIVAVFAFELVCLFGCSSPTATDKLTSCDFNGNKSDIEQVISNINELDTNKYQDVINALNANESVSKAIFSEDNTSGFYSTDENRSTIKVAGISFDFYGDYAVANYTVRNDVREVHNNDGTTSLVHTDNYETEEEVALYFRGHTVNGNNEEPVKQIFEGQTVYYSDKHLLIVNTANVDGEKLITSYNISAS